MSNKVTVGQVAQLIAQLSPREQLKLMACICEQLSAMPFADLEQRRQAQLRLAEELLTEVEDIEDDSQGESDAAEIIRRMRDARIARICQKDA